MNRTSAFLFLVAGATLWGQVGSPGGYPGQYPGGYPGQYPGGGGIPMPRRGGKHGKSGSDSTPQKTISVSGRLSLIEDKRVTVDVRDGRTVEFVRTDKTRFFREQNEIKASELKVGDQVEVEGTEADSGVLSATVIRIGTSTPDAPAEASEQRPTATTDAPKPIRDSEDPGPPVTKRGIPAPRATDPKIDPKGAGKSEPVEAEAPEEPPAVQRDGLIEKAHAASKEYSSGLPSYICKEFMARFMSSTKPADWQAQDIVSTEVVYQGDKETYRDIQINGKPVKKPIEQIGGSWSTGEFASMLLDIFSQSTAADFRPRGDDTIAGVRARVYNFTVQQPNSHWTVQAPSQAIRPAYRGAVWIDPHNGRVMRIEMGARQLPQEFPLDTVESSVDYGAVRLGEGEYLLPVRAETLSCQRGTSYCSRNTIDFRNYHRFEADSSVTFGTTEKK